ASGPTTAHRGYLLLGLRPRRPDPGLGEFERGHHPVGRGHGPATGRPPEGPRMYHRAGVRPRSPDPRLEPLGRVLDALGYRPRPHEGHPLLPIEWDPVGGLRPGW